jgi:hypothetical protein
MIAVKGRPDSSSRLYDGSIWKQPKEEGILRIVVYVIPPRVNDVLIVQGSSKSVLKVLACWYWHTVLVLYFMYPNEIHLAYGTNGRNSDRVFVRPLCALVRHRTSRHP